MSGLLARNDSAVKLSVGAALGCGQGEESSLAAEVVPEVLSLSGILAQDGVAKEGGSYVFQADGAEMLSGGRFELTRDDTLHLIGLLNSHQVDIAKRELGILLGRLNRPAVEGLTHRLFSALRRRTAEIADLEEKDLNATQKCSPAQGTRRTRRPVRRDEMSAPQEARSLPSEAPTLGKTRSEDQLGRMPDRTMSESRQLARHSSARGPISASEARLQERPTRSPRGPPPVTRCDELPQVFRRLTAPPLPGIMPGDEVVRGARAAITSSSTQPGGMWSPPPMTFGGIPASESGAPQTSAYLEALLEAHEDQTGVPATSSRRMLAEDIDPNVRRSPRVPEEKAKEIFDRLYRSGKEHRVRRRVYHELGLLVEQAKEAQTCTFEPRVPLAAYRGGQPPEGSITERLYQEGLDRIRRREELMQSAPVPTFRPQTIAALPPGMECLGQRPQGFLPEDDGGEGIEGEGITGEEGACQIEDGLVAPAFQEDQEVQEQGFVRNYEPTHVRLFREHEERLARRAQRQEANAEWRKHQYRPDISLSQASGPQVVRSSSYAGIPPLLEDVDYGAPVIATVESQARDSSLPMLNVDSPEPHEVEEAEVLLLVFSDSRMPVPQGFEEELLNDLALLGADCLNEVALHFLPGECIVAALQGPHDALTVLRDLRLFDLTVSGFRVGEVRWTKMPIFPIEDKNIMAAQNAPAFGASEAIADPGHIGLPMSAVSGGSSQETGLSFSGGRGGYHQYGIHRDQHDRRISLGTLSQRADDILPSVDHMNVRVSYGSATQMMVAPDQGHTLSREASNATLLSAASQYGVQRQFSGRLAQAAMQPPTYTPGRGGGGIIYPAELTGTQSSINFGTGILSPRLSVAGSTPQSSYVGQPTGTPGTPTAMLTQGRSTYGGPAYGGYQAQPLRSGGVISGAPMYAQPQPMIALESYPQVLRAGY